MEDSQYFALKSPVQAIPDTPSARFVAIDVMKKRAFDPISRMIDLAIELEEADAELGVPVNAQKRLAVYSTLAKYYAPQPRAVDINVKTDSRFTVQAVSFQDLLEQRKEFIPIQASQAGPALIGAIEEVALDGS